MTPDFVRGVVVAADWLYRHGNKSAADDLILALDMQCAAARAKAMIYALSVSGGKDSAAMWSWAKRTNLGLPGNASGDCCDTGWEADFDGARWRPYVDELAAAIGVAGEGRAGRAPSLRRGRGLTTPSLGA